MDPSSPGMLFVRLAVLWPSAFAVFGWLMAFDLDLFASAPDRWFKVAVTGLTVALVPFSLGVNDWFQFVWREVETDYPERFLRRQDTLYAGVFAMAVAAFPFIWLIGPTDYQVLPYFAAGVAFFTVRAYLAVPRAESPTPPERDENYNVEVPDHLKGDPRKRRKQP
ncbi:MAG: hypothetical protein K2X82_02115 [Gemmataceae bacterium]|nr:hypothetical protein [Gemmataceae bacterium]